MRALAALAAFIILGSVVMVGGQRARYLPVVFGVDVGGCCASKERVLSDAVTKFSRSPESEGIAIFDDANEVDSDLVRVEQHFHLILSDGFFATDRSIHRGAGVQSYFAHAVASDWIDQLANLWQRIWKYPYRAIVTQFVSGGLSAIFDNDSATRHQVWPEIFEAWRFNGNVGTQLPNSHITHDAKGEYQGQGLSDADEDASFCPPDDLSIVRFPLAILGIFLGFLFAFIGGLNGDYERRFRCAALILFGVVCGCGGFLIGVGGC